MLFHDDGFSEYSKWKGEQAHTNFSYFGQVVSATKRFLLANDKPYISFGITTVQDRFGSDGYHGLSQKYIYINFFIENNNATPPTRLTFKPSAHMAVHKRAVQEHARKTYGKMLALFRNKSNDARRLCCAMERMWHIFFGLTPHLPKSAMVTDILREEGALGAKVTKTFR